MNLSEYQKLAGKTAVKLENKKNEILTWGLGITGEAGDVASCIKKTIIHKNNKEEGIKENLGDTLWYVAMICNYFNWNMNDILEENVKKLEKRYEKGFTEKEAQRNGKMIDWNEDIEK